MRYFDLADNVYVPRRWHLGEVVSARSGEALDFIGGVAIPPDEPLSVEITREGLSLDFCLTSFAVPVATRRLGAAIAAAARPDVQELPLTIPGHPGFEVLNATRVVACLDDRRTTFTKWTEKDHRADLAGQYRMVTDLHVDTARVPPDAHFFRLGGWPVALIVSERVKDAMERVGCLGAKFQEVT